MTAFPGGNRGGGFRPGPSRGGGSAPPQMAARNRGDGLPFWEGPTPRHPQPRPGQTFLPSDRTVQVWTFLLPGGHLQPFQSARTRRWRRRMGTRIADQGRFGLLRGRGSSSYSFGELPQVLNNAVGKRNSILRHDKDAHRSVLIYEQFSEVRAGGIMPALLFDETR